GVLVLLEGPGQVSLSDKLLALEDVDADGHVWRGLEDPVVGVDDDAARASEGIDDVLGVGSDDVDSAVFGLAVGLNAQLDGHVEEVEVLLDFADGAEAFVAAEAVDGVLIGEIGRSGSVEPLRKKWGELLLGLGFGYLFEILCCDWLIRKL